MSPTGKNGGGIIANPEKLRLSLADGSSVVMAWEWRYTAFRFDPSQKDGSVNCWLPSACDNALIRSDALFQKLDNLIHEHCTAFV